MALRNQKLEGKVTIITGAGSGFGKSTALRFAREGADLSLTDVDLSALEAVAGQCEALGVKVVRTVGDIKAVKTRVEIVENTIKAFGKIDVLVNSAGIFKASSVVQPNDANFDEVMDINVRCLYRMTSLCVPHLIKSKGNIVNVSSVAAKYPVQLDGMAYCVSKAAVDMLTKSTALELSSYGIRVNSVNPGYCHTGILRYIAAGDELEKVWSEVGQDHALGRTGEVEEISNMITYLASEEASFMTGSNVVVDGGYLIHKHTVSN